MDTIVLSANTSWYLFNHRLPLATTIRDHGGKVVILSPEDSHSARLVDAGFDWLPLNLSRRGTNPLAEMVSVFRYLSIYRRLRPKLVHHFTIKPVLYGSLAARALGIPAVVNSVTGLGYLYISDASKQRVLRSIVKPLYRMALSGGNSWSIFQNQQDLGEFVENGIANPAKTDVISGSGVDIDRFTPVPEPRSIVTILYTGRILWDKGIDELVKASKLLKARDCSVRIVLAGSPDPGNPSSVPMHRLEKWVDAGLVEWVGHSEDMPEMYAQCHIVAFPSYREGLPRSLTEAAASGRPIVASDVPGCRDVVRHGENGLLVAPRDPQSLADAIEVLAKDPPLRKLMGNRSRQIAEEQFSTAIINHATLGLYRRVLGDSFLMSGSTAPQRDNRGGNPT